MDLNVEQGNPVRHVTRVALLSTDHEHPSSTSRDVQVRLTVRRYGTNVTTLDES